MSPSLFARLSLLVTVLTVSVSACSDGEGSEQPEPIGSDRPQTPPTEPPPPDGLRLPSAEHGRPLPAAAEPVVRVDATTAVSLDGTGLARVASVDDVEWRIEALIDRLERIRQEHARLHPSEAWHGTVQLQVDERVEFRILKKVLFSTALAGYANTWFVVRGDDDASGLLTVGRVGPPDPETSVLPMLLAASGELTIPFEDGSTVYQLSNERTPAELSDLQRRGREAASGPVHVSIAVPDDATYAVAIRALDTVLGAGFESAELASNAY